MQIYIAFWYIIFNYFNFFEFLKIVLINMVTILMMSAKMVTLGLLKIKVFWSKVYDVIIFFHDITNRVLSRDSNYIVDVVMWPKFDNSSISIREVITTTILWGFDQQKTIFFEGWSWLQLNNLRLVLDMSWKFYTSVAKELTLELKKCLGLIPAFLEVTGELGLSFSE